MSIQKRDQFENNTKCNNERQHSTPNDEMDSKVTLNLKKNGDLKYILVSYIEFQSY